MARDALWNYAAFSLALAGSFAVTALGFRQLSDSDMGVYGIAAATTGLMIVVDPALALGISRSISRLLARRGSEAEDASFVVAAHAALVWVGGCIVALGAALGGTALLFDWFGLDRGTWLMVGAITLAGAIQIATAALPGVLTGHSDFAALARASLVQAVLLVAVTAALLPKLGVSALGVGQLAAVLLARASLVPTVLHKVPGLPSLYPVRPSMAALSKVARFATPLLVLAIAGQAIVWSDLVVLGAAASAGVVALFRVGTVVPAALSSLLYRVYDVSFPQLSRGGPGWQTTATSALTRVFSAIGAVVFASVIAVRGDVVTVLTGDGDHFAELVVTLSAVTWALNVPAHGLALLAISRNDQGVFIPLVVCEAIANILLTIVLVVSWEPAGAAWATLVTLGLSNVVALPLLLRHRVAGAVRLVLVDGGGTLLAVGAPTIVILELLSRSSLSGPIRWASLIAVGLALLFASAACAAGSSGRRAIMLSLQRRDQG